MKLKLLATAAILFCTLKNFSQEKSPAKFGKITAEDFTVSTNSSDSSASAIILADIGSTAFVGNSNGWFSLVFKRFRRVKILNSNGYDIANVEIPLYSSSNNNGEEKLNSLKAITYNLENGQVIETKLDSKSSLFEDKINKHWVEKKFTFPNIKAGSIIEFQYEINSDFLFNLQPWTFQSMYPTLWSEYTVSLPEFFDYITLTQGKQQYFINTSKNTSEQYRISESGGTGPTERFTINANETEFRWVMKDVPALKPESFTSTIKNHMSGIEFQLSEYKAPLTPRSFMPTWSKTAADLLQSEDFGYALSRDNSWLNDVMDEAINHATTELDKAKNIYAYVRDHFTCTGHSSKYIEKPLKQTLKSRNGNEAEINLLLTAMLLKAGLNADPVLLSTRSHGYVYAMYPLLERFNYVISRLQVGDDYYYLDASWPVLGFNRLDPNVYNGHARVINKMATPLSFIADSLMATSVSSVIIINDEKGNLTGTMKYAPGSIESYYNRETIKEKGKENYFSKIRKEFGTDVEIYNTNIDSLNKYDEPLEISFDFNLKNEKEDILYINPMFSEGTKENPFKSAERTYPVEMPFAFDETYLLKMDVPEGYVVDELPKPIMIKLNENDDGFFEYVLSESGGSISLRSRICLKRATFMPDEYPTLREFYNLVVKKHNEQIVFKKKK